VLIVEDDGALGAVMRETLRDDGYDADVARTEPQRLRQALVRRPT
jgi:DNA-binding response OmpR family regulator